MPLRLFKKNDTRTWKEIVWQMHAILEWHQEMAEDDQVTLGELLNVLREGGIHIEGGYEPQ